MRKGGGEGGLPMLLIDVTDWNRCAIERADDWRRVPGTRDTDGRRGDTVGK